MLFYKYLVFSFIYFKIFLDLFLKDAIVVETKERKWQK